jgi:hypothetical protein
MAGAETVKEASKDSEMAANEAEGENMIPNPYKGVGLMVKTLSGHVVEIKVDQDRPKSFKVQYVASCSICVKNVRFGNYSHSLFVCCLIFIEVIEGSVYHLRILFATR